MKKVNDQISGVDRMASMASPNSQIGGTRKLGARIACPAILGLVALVIAVISQVAGSSAYLWVWLELVVLAILVATGPWLLHTSPLTEPLRPFNLFLVFFIAFFVLKPIDSLLLGHQILTAYGLDISDTALISWAIFLSTVSLLCVYAGFALVVKVRTSVPRSEPAAASPWSDRTVTTLAALLVTVNFLAVIVFVSRVGGLGKYFSSIPLGLLLVQGSLHWFPLVATLVLPAALLWFIHHYGRSSWFHSLWLAMPALILLQFDPNLTRQNVLALALALLIAYLYLRTVGPALRQRDLPWLGILATALVVFAVGHELLRIALDSVSSLPRTPTTLVHQLLEPFKPTETYWVLTSMFPKRYSFDFGRHYLDIFALAVPRFIWPNKPTVFGYEFVSYGPLHTGNYYASFTYLGELYVAGGLPAIAVGSTALGAVFGFLERLRLNAVSSRMSLLFFAALVSIWETNFVRSGFLDSTINLLATAAIPLALIAVFRKDGALRRATIWWIVAGLGATAALAAVAFFILR